MAWLWYGMVVVWCVGGMVWLWYGMVVVWYGMVVVWYGCGMVWLWCGMIVVGYGCGTVWLCYGMVVVWSSDCKAKSQVPKSLQHDTKTIQCSGASVKERHH